MSEPAGRLPTFADILALGEHVHAEIIAGELVIHASPSWPHGYAATGLSGELGAPFQRGRGGPGGWWILTEVDIELSSGDDVRPDLIGIRRSRMPSPPTERPLRVDPEFVAEILSPSTAAFDLGEKRAAYHTARVEHVWFVDPSLRTLTVLRWSADGYVILGVYRGGPPVALPPFEAVAVDVSALFPAEPEPGAAL